VELDTGKIGENGTLGNLYTLSHKSDWESGVIKIGR